MITRFSVATTTDVALRLTEHLRRADGQEDCCFVPWRPSTGSPRTAALVVDLVLPGDGERMVHGTVDFTSAYFLRAAGIATERGCGLGFIHSHPRGRRWQRLNDIDHAAEESFAAQTLAITGLPQVGLTFAGADAGYGSRIWQHPAPRTYVPTEAENVRVVGGRFAVTFNDRLVPVPKATNRQLRTVSAWGRDAQNDLARLHAGVVGTGSVGMIVVEAPARTGIQKLSLVDFDTVEDVNLDRLLHATPGTFDCTGPRRTWPSAPPTEPPAPPTSASRRTRRAWWSRTATPPPPTATCSSPASTGPGPAPPSTFSLTPTSSPSSTAASPSMPWKSYT